MIFLRVFQSNWFTRLRIALDRRLPRFSASVHVLADGIRKLSKVSNNCRRLKYTAA